MMTTTTTDPLADPREEVWRRYPNEAREIPHLPQVRRCSSPKCRALVWDGQTRTGKRCAFDVRPDTGEALGTSHFRTCRDVESFRRRS